MLLHGHCLAATFTDNFSSDLDYLVNGVAGTIWDGVYFGVGEFQNTGVGGGGPGATLVCDANITAPNTLTIESTGTAWEHADDDGFFLFKIVPGDFSVRVVSPFDNSSYNTAGLMARAFDPGGDPFGGSEDDVSWTRFNQFGYANYLRNEVNGIAQQINPGGFPNNNYWLRMDRVNGMNFLLYQKATSGGPWQLVSFPAPVSGTVLRRADFAGLPMQVGIIHATFTIPEKPRSYSRTIALPTRSPLRSRTTCRVLISSLRPTTQRATWPDCDSSPPLGAHTRSGTRAA